MRGLTVVLFVWFAIPSVGATAQSAQPFEIGELLRITAPTCHIEKQIARYLRIYRDTLTVQADSELALPVAGVTQLDVSRGFDHRPTLVGLAAGAVAGVVIGIVAAADEDSEIVTATRRETAVTQILNSETHGSSTTISGAVVGPIAGALIGAFLGGVVGKTLRKHRWEDVPLDRLRLSFLPRSDSRFGLAMTLAF